MTPVDAIYNAAMWERYLEMKERNHKQVPSDTSLLSTSPEEIKRQIEQFNERRENGIHIVV